jgi:hypothetical protein
MSGSDRKTERAVRERAYFIWEREGRPQGRADAHWLAARVEEALGGRSPDDEFAEEEKVLAGRHDANLPAMLTKDVHGG